jgi:hypothetical protein
MSDTPVRINSNGFGARLDALLADPDYNAYAGPCDMLGKSNPKALSKKQQTPKGGFFYVDGGANVLPDDVPATPPRKVAVAARKKKRQPTTPSSSSSVFQTDRELALQLAQVYAREALKHDFASTFPCEQEKKGHTNQSTAPPSRITRTARETQLSSSSSSRQTNDPPASLHYVAQTTPQRTPQMSPQRTPTREKTGSRIPQMAARRPQPAQRRRQERARHRDTSLSSTLLHDWQPIPQGHAALQVGGMSVRQGLTKQQIARIPTKPYCEMTQAEVKNGDSACSICLNEFEPLHKVSLLKCKHAFHATCVKPWLSQQTSCPICRKDQRGWTR